MAQRFKTGETVQLGESGREGILGVPDGASGIVVFAHGSGSGRFSPRNNFVASELQRGGVATLLVDLLSPEEELDRSSVFDIQLLAARLAEATQWVRAEPRTAHLKIGCFGASTGAAAALVAETESDADIAAIVSRGGRPDLAGSALERVRAPTLLIVGGLDAAVISLNEQAYDRLTGEKDLEVVPGAGHLFEEPGTLEMVARQARDWFRRYLGPRWEASDENVRTQPDLR
jgi:putative phosphoribosyl transferase